ncbi:pectinesterase inhibitor 10-like [Malus domestica]|uniref:pectinesterase inhibitor 10-like n=1 Tax=Malus domestica TaxID=3750 RepID=UPI0010AAF0D7|nr:pectinesterase inhibitor 4-like [Malus domestica]
MARAASTESSIADIFFKIPKHSFKIHTSSSPNSHSPSYSSSFPTLIPTVGLSSNDSAFIRTSCNTTLYLDLRYTSMSRFARVVQDNLTRLAKVAISVNLARMHQLSSTANSRGESSSFRFQMSNVQMWMSTALTNEETWTDGFDVVERMR